MVRNMAIGAAVLLCLLATAGCPASPGARVAGKWNLYIGDPCSAVSSTPDVVEIYADGTLVFTHYLDFPGTWELNGDRIALSVNINNGPLTVLTGTLDGSVITDGTMTAGGVDTGVCWTGEKVED